MPITDPQVKLVTLFTANWNAANVSNITPRIHTGWYNSAWGKTPQLTITNPMTFPLGGSETGVTAMGGNGTRVRVLATDLFVSVWGNREMIDPATGTSFETLGINPKAFIYDASMEVRRIIEANTFTDSELDGLYWRGMRKDTDVRIKPAVFTYLNEVRLIYREAF